MAVTDWIQTVAVIYFAWQQNRIFTRQNEIFANQAGQSAMRKPSQIFRLARYWPTMIMAGLAVLTGYDIYARHGAPPVVPWWLYLLLILPVAAIASVTGKFRVSSQEMTKEPSKLVIHSANYRAWKGGGETFDVTDFLRKIIVGDCLIHGPIENHSFMVDGKNYVPRDPLFGQPKRLEVTYSYDGEASRTIPRSEHSRLVLPEDSAIGWLEKEIERLKAAQPKPAQYPVPELRMRMVAMCSELQGFLAEHGDEPVVNRLQVGPGFEDKEDFQRRVRTVLDPWRAKFIGDYCLRFGESVPKLRDEIRARAKIDDNNLNCNIELAAKNRNSSRSAVEAIIEGLWELAIDVNT